MSGRSVVRTMRQVATTQGPSPGGPQTRAELESMMRQRVELKEQVGNLAGLRRELVIQGRSPNQTVSAFQGQLAEIDTRAQSLISQIGFLDDRIADGIGRGLLNEPNVPPPTAPAGWQIASLPPGAPWLDARVVAGALGGEALLFVLVGVGLWRFAWRRMHAQTIRALGDNSRQLQQLQESIDVVAVEVERISEGQRFVSKMLGESESPAVPVSRKDKVSAP